MSMGVGFLLAVRLQRVVSLADPAFSTDGKDVSKKRDYTVRAVKYHEDEVGLLIDSFNEMLTQIRNGMQRSWPQTRPLTEQQDLLLQELTEAAEYVTSLLPPQLTGAVQATWKFLPSVRLGGDAFGYHWLNAEQFAIYL
jgi:methyl-accepting chemotaxis protein